MQLSLISLALTRIYGGSASFSPLSLFAAGEQGAWYDPSDLSTMFQDAAGTTPVTADGQPVGLILDKSQGLALGSELITNAADREFSSDTGFWAKYSITISGGACNYSAVSAGNGLAKNSFSTAGKYYEIKVDVISYTAGGIRIFVGGNRGVLINSVGSFTQRVLAGSADTFVVFEATGASTTLSIDNVSIKEITGNHASQTTAAKRPVLASTGLSKWINYDAVDDVLNTTFPSSLGSSCTVCRANVGGAPTILTGQTIGTSYADSTDNAGLIIINRALTGQETTDVTAWLTAKGATA